MAMGATSRDRDPGDLVRGVVLGWTVPPPKKQENGAQHTYPAVRSIPLFGTHTVE